MLIYNYTSLNDDAPMTWGTVAKNIVKSVNDYPLLSALWCAEFRLTNYTFIYHFYTLFLHLIPACLFDLGMLIVGQKPRFIYIQQKLIIFSTLRLLLQIYLLFFFLSGFTKRTKKFIRI